ncbi:YcdB/YcdC domain-containing protein [Ammoniphilus sp. CFH 90114]|uniref:YcdB/YcdC domain-containing protein n=1 Tax=Ammoniphilus sp. CFH 90114 TaxID=2493665 RepID=UPI00100F347C|nr:YcdB/YcdC domain-containing protein [Ammoniphilus sp. CFH 90114]RXT15377.1 hypothetical protein EIZ39_04010 [Ammoniphilus sp. CFH 90114]
MNMKKRWLQGILATSLVFAAVPSYASELKVNAEQVNPVFSKEVETTLSKIYKLTPELKEINLEEKNYFDASEYGPAGWSIIFSNRPKDADPNSRDYIEAHIGIEAVTGKLIHFSVHHPEWASEKLPDEKLTKVKALAFAQELYGEELKNYEMAEFLNYGASGPSSDDPRIYTQAGVTFHRLIHGVELWNLGSFQVYVNEKGRVTQLYHHDRGDQKLIEDITKFPLPEKAISKEEAKKIYRDKIEMELNYAAEQPTSRTPLNWDKQEKKSVLKYDPSQYGFLNAVTGEELKLFYGGDEQTRQRLSLIPQNKTETVLSKEAAASFIKKYHQFDLADLEYYEMEHVMDDSRVEYNWSNRRSLQTDGKAQPPTFVSLSTDKKGNVLGVHIQVHPIENSKPLEANKITQDEALKRAIQFLEGQVEAKELELSYIHDTTKGEQVPEWVNQEKLTQMRSYESPKYRFSFVGLHKGVTVSDQYYSVSVDANSGQVLEFQLPQKFDYDALPSAQPVLSKEEAEDLFMENLNLNLYYYWPEYYGQYAPSPVLIYRLDGKKEQYIDAHKKEPVPFN